MTQKKYWHRRVLTTAGESLSQLTIPISLMGYLIVKGAIAVVSEGTPILLRVISEAQNIASSSPISRNLL